MDKALWIVACALLASHANAQDYVARAQTTCAAVDGTARYAPCMTSAAASICEAQSVQMRASCYKDFERFHLAMADQAEAQRRAFKADVEQRIERLRTLGMGTPSAAGYYRNPIASRTLDDGLPDIQPSWGADGDPYANLKKYVALPQTMETSGMQSAAMGVCSVTCASMNTLAEARDYLNRGATQLDADHDGNPCEGRFAR